MQVFLAVQDAELIGYCMITATGHVLASFLGSPEEEVCFECVPVDLLWNAFHLPSF